MSNVKSAYGSNNQAITCTLASLANGSARLSTAIDNTSNLFLDALFLLKIKSGASSVSATGFANIYVYSTVDGGTTYTEGVSGTDGAATIVSPTNLKFVSVINIVANATSYVGGPFSVAALFGGSMPDHWGIVVQNQSGAAFDSTEGNHLKIYQGVYSTVA